MTRLRWLGSAGALAAAVLLAAPLAASPDAIPDGNLVRNPGAEESPGALFDTVVAPAGWTTTGSLSAWSYGALGDRPDKAFARSIGGGETFFSGGPGGIAGQPTATQSIDVSGAAIEIDAGGVAARLKAHIGGYTVSEDLLRIDAVFLDRSGTRLGGVRIGPVNREDRKRQTTLLERSATANVPKGTRRIDVVISVTVDNNGKNHAYADNISLTLGKASPPTAGKSTLTAACVGKTLVATVRPAKGAAVSSVTFLVNGTPVAIDRKAPFVARIATAGLAAQLKVTARVQAGGKSSALTKSIRRC
ncbi:MAG: hypothetical protein MSC30_16815 [Gaiellaceae bacterium MAG52_C11]|nr:hypothetical protein [Candidatus Gaiellasilicea maunaloa]